MGAEIYLSGAAFDGPPLRELEHDLEELVIASTEHTPAAAHELRWLWDVVTAYEYIPF